MVMEGRSCWPRSPGDDRLAVVLVEAHPVQRVRGRAVASGDLPGHDPGGHDVALVGAVFESDQVPDLVECHGLEREGVLVRSGDVADTELHLCAPKPAVTVGLPRDLTGATVGQLAPPE